MTSRNDHWRALQSSGLVTAERPQAAPRPLWFIRALQGFAAWIASLFLIGFLVVAIDLDDNVAGLLITGALLITASWFLLKLDQSGDFFVQLALAFSLAGQLLITMGMINLADGNAALVASVVAAVAIAVIVIMDDYLQRFLAALAACFALAFICFDLTVGGLAPPLVAALCCAAWLTEERWGASRALVEPVAVAITVGALTLAMWLSGTLLADRLSVDDNLVPYWFDALVVLGLLVVTLLRILADLGDVSASRRTGWLAVLVIGASVMMFALPGAGIGLLVLLLSIRSQRPTLAVLSVLLLLGLFARYYYTLELTLLTKSLLLIAAGIALLVLQQLTAGLTPGKRAPILSLVSWPNVRQWLAGTVVLLAVIYVLKDAWQNERTLDEGRVVLLELAPVDPRSLMQGDYMRLRFAIAAELESRNGDERPPSGALLVRVGPDGVGEYAGLDDGSAIPDDVVRIPYRRAGNGVELLTDAWFFQEGDAGIYENARYGEFRVSDNGRVLLNAMRDDKLEVLGSGR